MRTRTDNDIMRIATDIHNSLIALKAHEQSRGFLARAPRGASHAAIKRKIVTLRELLMDLSDGL